MEKYYKSTLFALIMMFASTSIAAVNPNDYYNNIGKVKNKKDSLFATDNINKQDMWGKYQNKVDASQNAPEQSYYSDEGSMNHDADAAKSTSTAYKNAMAIKNEEPDINLIKKSAYMKDNQIFVDDAYNVAHGISDTKINCATGAASICHYEYEPRNCEKTIPQNIQCTTEPVVTVHDIPVAGGCNHYQVTAKLTGSKWNGEWTFNVSQVAGANSRGMCETQIKYQSIQGTDETKWPDITSTVTMPANYEGHVASFGYLGNVYNDTGFGLSANVYGHPGFNFHSYSSGYHSSFVPVAKQSTPTTYTVRLSGWLATGQGKNLLVYGTFVEYSPTYKIAEINSWTSSCNYPQCHYSGNQTCTVAGGTRTIDGVAIYQPCWKYTQVYTCSKTPPVNTCASLENPKCNFVGQSCLYTIAGLCVDYHYDYSCQVEKCKKKPLKCGQPSFCLDGNCFNPDNQAQLPNQFGKAAAEMAAAQAAADNAKQNADGTISIFEGQRMGCSKAIAGSNDCCTNGGGWNPVGSCSEDEKQLAKQKQKQLNIDNGSYCKNKTLGVCTSNEFPSCVYPSLIVKDIIFQGVIGQFYGGSASAFYGGSKNTRCRGITPVELSRINFDQIDFSNIEADLKKHMNIPDSTKTDSGATNKANCISNGTCKNQPQQETQPNCIADGTCQPI